MMREQIRGFILRVMRVPTEPSVPAGSRTAQVFRAAPNYYRYRILLWVFAQIGALGGLIAGLLFLSTVGTEGGWFGFAVRAAEALAWTAFIAQIPFSYLMVRLDFELRWYILSDRSLRIREGIVSLREKTMTFANIQNIAIRQNPLQRLLGIADLQVRTAGGGAGASEKSSKQVGESMHEAWFRGVDNAEAIREAIRERVRMHRDAGLGDPDEPEAVAIAGSTADSPAYLEAARELLGEVVQLRHSVQRP